MLARIDEEITFKKLEALIAFLDTGSLAKAAELLDTTPVSVHRALHSLEAGLKCQLFRNEGRTLVANRAALLLADTAREVLGLMNHAVKLTRQEAGFSADLIRIGSLYSLTMRTVPEILVDLKIRRADLRVELVLGSNADLREKLQAGEIDAVLMGLGDEDPAVETVWLLDDEIYLTVPRDAPFPDDALIDLKDFANADFVALAGGFVTSRGFREAANIAGFEPKVVMEVGDIFSLMNLVIGGVGYGLLPGRVRTVYSDQLRFLRLKPQYRQSQRIGLAFLRSRERDPNLLALAAACRIARTRIQSK